MGARIDAALEEIAGDKYVARRWPKLGTLLSALGPMLRRLEHEMDWGLSGDSPIEDDAAWDATARHAILEVAMKAADDHLFPRGKWATIQAVQERMKGRFIP